MRNKIGGLAFTLAFGTMALGNLALATAPANDNWADATVIASLPFSTTSPGPAPDLTEATVETTDPDPPPCLPLEDSVKGTVWYKYSTGANYEYVTLKSEVAHVDTSKALVLIAVYTGTPGAFSIVSGGCNTVYFGPPPPAPAGPALTRIAGLRLAPNTTYSIEIAVETTGQTGNALAFTVDPAQQYLVTSTADGDTGSCSPASATVSNCSSLRDAISASNANPGAVIIPAGTYKLSIKGAYDTDNHTGDLDAIPGMGIYGAGMNQTIISADTTLSPPFDDRILMLDPKQTGSMAYAIGDLTLTNGNAPPPASFVSFQNSGGGLCAAGGGSNNDGDFVGLERVAVKSNTAFQGGGIEFLAPGTIRDSWIDGNTSNGEGNGGGIDAVSSRLISIGGSTISGNSETGTGSGGGGLSVYGNVNLVNSTVSGNASRAYGGGAYFFSGNVTVASSTIVFNEAFHGNIGKTDIGAGIYIDGGTDSIVNSVIAYNFGGFDDPSNQRDCLLVSGTLSESYNIVQYPNNCPIAAGEQIDPKVLPTLVNHGGLTPTHSLDPTGPAIDTGDPDGCANPDVLKPLLFPPVLLAYDQRGPGYPRISGAHCDKGAFEWANIIFQNGFESPPP